MWRRSWRSTALLKELLLLAVSIQDAGLAEGVGRSLFSRLFEQAKTDQTGFFNAVVVQRLDRVAETHCAAGWPVQPRARSAARQAATELLQNQHLDGDPVLQMVVMEYLRGFGRS